MGFTSDAMQCAFADGLGFNPKADLDGLAIVIFRWRIHHSAKVSSEVLFNRELGGHCTHDWFYMHQSAISLHVGL